MLAAEIQTYEEEIDQLNYKTEKLLEQAGARLASRHASYAKINPPLQLITRSQFGVQAQLMRRGSPVMLPGLFQTPQDMSPLSELDGVSPESAKMEDVEREEADMSDLEDQPQEASVSRIPQRSQHTFPSYKPNQQEPVMPQEDDMKPQVVTDKGLAYILRPFQSTEQTSGSSPLTGLTGHTPDGGVGQPLPSPDFVVVQEVHPDQLPTIVGKTTVPGTDKPLVIQDPRTGELMVAEPAEDPKELQGQLTAYIPKLGKVMILSPNKEEALEAYRVEETQELASHPIDIKTAAQEKYLVPEEAKAAHPEFGKAEEPTLQMQVVTDKGLAFVLRPLEDTDFSSGVPSPLSGLVGIAPDGGVHQPAVDYVVLNDVQPDSLPFILGSDLVPVAEKPFVIQDPKTGQLMIAEPATEPHELQDQLTAYIPKSGRAVILDPSRNNALEACPVSDIPFVSEHVTAENITPVELKPWKTNLTFLLAEDQESVETLSMPESQQAKAEKPVITQLVTSRGPAYILRPCEEGMGVPSPLSGQDGIAPDGGQGTACPQYVISEEASPQSLPKVIGTKTIPYADPLQIEDPKTGKIMMAYPAERPEELSSEVAAFCEQPEMSPIVIHYPKTNKVEIAQPVESVPTAEKQLEQLVTEEGPAYILKSIRDLPRPMKASLPRKTGTTHHTELPDLIVTDDTELEHVPAVVTSRPASHTPSKTLRVRDPRTGVVMEAFPAYKPEELKTEVSVYIRDTQQVPVKIHYPVPSQVFPSKQAELVQDTDIEPGVEREKVVAKTWSVQLAKTMPDEVSLLLHSQPRQHMERAPAVNQIVTEEGPAYVLRPIEGVLGNEIASPTETEGISPVSSHLTPSQVAELEKVPAIITSRPNWQSSEEPLKIKDPLSGYIMVALPCEDPRELQTEVTAYINDADSGIVKIHHPDEEALPLEEYSFLEKKPFIQRSELEHPTRQLVTNQGPAYILRPVERSRGASTASPLDGEQGTSPDGGDYVITSETFETTLPTAVTFRPISRSQLKPLTIKDPRTGEILEAIPAENPQQLKTEITAVIMDLENKPVTIFHPRSGQVLVAQPVDNMPNMETIQPSKATGQEAPQEQLVTEKGPAYVLKSIEILRPDATYLQQTPFTPSEDTELDKLPLVVSSRPVSDMPLEGITIKDPITGHVMLAVPCVEPTELLTETTVFIDDTDIKIHYPQGTKPTPEEITAYLVKQPLHLKKVTAEEMEVPQQQVVTEEGPAYVLKPVGMLRPEHMQETTFTPSEDAELDKLPLVVSSRPVSDAPSESITIKDPITGDVMVAVPCVEPTELWTNTTVFIDDTDNAIKIHHPQSTKPMPEEITVYLEKQPLQLKRQEKLPSQQLVTDEGLAFILRPVRETHPVDRKKSKKSASKGHLPAENILNGIEIKEIPQVKTSTPITISTEEPIKIKDPKTGHIMEAIPAIDPQELQTNITAYLKDDDQKTVKIHHPHMARGMKRPWTSSSDPSQVLQGPAEKGLIHKPKVASGSKISKRTEGYTFSFQKPQIVPLPAEHQALKLDDKMETDVIKDCSPITHQLVTDKGPAYSLQPLDLSNTDYFGSPLEGEQGSSPGGGVGSASADYLVVQEMPYEHLPRIVGTRPVTEDQPLTVQDPKTGKVLAARPAQSLNDLKKSISAYVPDGNKDQAMEIFDPATGQVAVALPTEIAEELVMELDGKSEVPSKAGEPYLPSVSHDSDVAITPLPPFPTNQDGTTAFSVPLEDQMEASQPLDDSSFMARGEPVKTSTPFFTKTQFEIKLLSGKTTYQTKPSQIPVRTDGKTGFPENVSQLVTDQGPVYVLRPDDGGVSSPLTGQQGNAPDGGMGPPSADFVVSQDTLPQQQPVVIGAREVPESLSLIVSDPRTGKTLVARPAENLKELDEKLTAYIPDNANQPVRICDPNKSEDQIAIPTEKVPVYETALAQRILPSEKPLTQKRKDLYPKLTTSTQDKEAEIQFTPEKEDFKSDSWQLLAKEGLIYVLEPIDTEAGKPSLPGEGNISDDGEGMPSADFEVSPDSLLDQQPVVTGAQCIPKTKPLIIKDPETGQTFAARPAQSLDEIAEEITAFIPDDTGGTVRVHDPHRIQDHSAIPLGEVPVDETASVKRDGGVGKPKAKLSKAHEKSCATEEGEKRVDESDLDVAPVQEINQLLTDHGPAYILKLFDEEVSIPLHGLDGYAPDVVEGPPSADFIISAESLSQQQLPHVTGARKVPRSQPLIIQDPGSGKTLVARPAQSLKELEEGVSSFIPDSLKQPIRVHDPHSKEDKIAVPAEQVPVDEAVLADRVHPVHQPLAPRHKDDAPNAQDMEEKMEEFPSVKATPVEMMQLLSDQGPVYVLTPIGSGMRVPLKGREGVAPGRGESLLPSDTLISADTEPMQEPVVMGACCIPQSNRLIVEDPGTHQMFVARPAQNLKELSKEVTACLPDETHKHIRIHDPHLNEDPIEMVVVEEAAPSQKAGKKKKPKKRKKKGAAAEKGETKEIPDGASSREEIKQLLSNQGPVYVLTPMDGGVSFPLIGQEGSAPDGGVGSPSVAFVISPNTQPQQEPPVVTGARNIPKSKSFVVTDPGTGETLIARPAQSLNELTDEVTACISDDTDQPIHVHNPQTNQDQIAIPFETVGVDKPGLVSLQQDEVMPQASRPEIDQPVTKPPVSNIHAKTTSQMEATPVEEIEQLLTDQGPVYVLTPEYGEVVSLLNGKEGDSQDKGEGPPSDFVIMEDTKSNQQPVVTGARNVPQSKPLRVRDPRTGQTLVSRPAQSLNDPDR